MGKPGSRQQRCSCRSRPHHKRQVRDSSHLDRLSGVRNFALWRV